MSNLEKWRDVKDYEGIYQVSSFGRVKSLSRNRSTNGVIKERILKSCKNSNGYLVVTLRKQNKPITRNIHVMVAIAFLDHIPNGMNVVVDHIDEDKNNNRANNLQITSNRENLLKYYKNKKLLEQLLLLTEEEKTRAINFIGSSLNLKTITEAKKETGKSYNGIKNFGKVVKLLGKNYVISS